jgi:hypothetical protein
MCWWRLGCARASRISRIPHIPSCDVPDGNRRGAECQQVVCVARLGRQQGCQVAGGSAALRVQRIQPGPQARAVGQRARGVCIGHLRWRQPGERAGGRLVGWVLGGVALHICQPHTGDFQ